MIKIKMNFNRNKLRKQLEDEQEKLLAGVVEEVVDRLASVTPVDTGLAQQSWFSVKDGRAYVITNSQDYVKYLNQGSSEQAPANFIESTVLQYGYSIGPIVTYD
jgi:hypothetical protein